MGWVVHRHGVLYAQEYGWDERFEALVAEIAARIRRARTIRRASAAGSPRWTARSSARCSSSRTPTTVAQLRLLLVEPKARGLGIGARLVDECVRFARQRRLPEDHALDQQRPHRGARRSTRRRGFALVHRERHHSFGHNLVGETWDLRL